MDEGKDWMREQIRRLDPVQVLDIGPGQGTYFDLAARVGQRWEALEIWEPYIERYALRERYARVVVEDVRQHDWTLDSWDIVIFGDVVEHMTRADAPSLFVEGEWQRKRQWEREWKRKRHRERRPE